MDTAGLTSNNMMNSSDYYDNDTVDTTKSVSGGSIETWFADPKNAAYFAFVTEGVLLTSVSVVGLIGNLMSIVVLVRVTSNNNQIRGFTNLLRTLACFDALFLATAIVAFGLPQLSAWYSRNVFFYLVSISFGFLHTFRTGSVCVTVAVNFERFYAIVFPLRQFTFKKHLLRVSILFAVLYNLPKFFEVYPTYNPATNATGINVTWLRKHPMYVSVYVVWSKVILLEILPYLTIIVCNSFIIYKITKSAQFRRRFAESQKNAPPKSPAISMDDDHFTTTIEGEDVPEPEEPLPTFQEACFKKQKEEHSLGLVLVGISLVFILCQLIKVVPDLYEILACDKSANGRCKMPIVMDIFIRISHLLVCFNSSVNFAIYYLNGKKLRKAWIDTYGFFGRKKRGGANCGRNSGSGGGGGNNTQNNGNANANCPRNETIRLKNGRCVTTTTTNSTRLLTTQLSTPPPTTQGNLPYSRHDIADV